MGLANPVPAGLPLGLVALWVRLKVEETPVFREVSQGHGRSPADDVRPAETTTGMAIVLGIARLMGWAAAGYFLVVMPSYLQVALGASFRESLVAGVVANLGFAASILPAGALSDRVGRKPLMLAGALSIAVLALPMLNLLQDNDTSTGLRFAVVFVAGAIVGLMAGPGPAMLSEMFHTRVRYTGQA